MWAVLTTEGAFVLHETEAGARSGAALYKGAVYAPLARYLKVNDMHEALRAAKKPARRSDQNDCPECEREVGAVAAKYRHCPHGGSR
jgi:hypothetical protein